MKTQLGDFGSTRVLEGVATTYAGTPLNMAPEVLTGQPYEFSSDIWSLGSSIYELMTLNSLFNVDTMKSLMHQVRVSLSLK